MAKQCTSKQKTARKSPHAPAPYNMSPNVPSTCSKPSSAPMAATVFAARVTLLLSSSFKKSSNVLWAKAVSCLQTSREAKGSKGHADRQSSLQVAQSVLAIARPQTIKQNWNVAPETFKCIASAPGSNSTC